MSSDFTDATDVRVVLSRKNLLALLHKLDMPGSGREIHNDFCFVNGEEDRSIKLILNCEDDDEHYAHASRGEFTMAGTMHPDTEAFIADTHPPAA